MQQPLIPQRVTVALLVAAVLLPIAICVVVAVGWLLAGMGDPWGQVFLFRIALLGGILWVIDLVGLVLSLAVGVLGRPTGPEDEE
ncbi:MAG: hypothetical protein ABFC63_06720 [Thermoguttaceae bacterium]